VSDYLVSLAARSINQNRGYRFLTGELRPRLASRFEPRHASVEAWQEPPPSFEEVPGPQAAGLDVLAPAASLEQRDRARPRPAIHHPTSRAALALPEQELAPFEGEVTAPGAQSPAPLRSALSNQQPSRMLDEPRREEDTVLSGEEYPRLSPLPQPRLAREAPVTNTALPESPTQPQPDYLPRAMEQAAQGIVRATGQPASVEPLPSRGDALDQYKPPEPSPGTLVYEQPVERRQSVHPQRPPTASPSAPSEPVAHAAARVESVLATTGTPSVRPAPEQSRQVLQGALNRLNEPGAEAEPSAIPTVNVTIGRVEVRAVPAPTPPASKPRPTPAMTLEEYLRRRAAGGGS